MKKYLILLATGILNAAIPLSLLIIMENDLRYLFVSAMVILFISAVITNNLKVNLFVKLTFLFAPLLGGYSYMILREVPTLWYLLIPWMASTFMGFSWGRIKFLKFSRLLSVGAVILLTYVFNSYFIPQLIRSMLSEELHEPAPRFEITDLEGNVLSSEELKGKTLVIDFFGTWCGPCIQELPELEKVKEHFENDESVMFLIVNNDQPGDSPEKVKKFKEKHEFDFNFYYDYGGKTHELFGMRGVPSMVIVDKNGNIRLKKAGYNKSESDFSEHLISFISRIDDGES